MTFNVTVNKKLSPIFSINQTPGAYAVFLGVCINSTRSPFFCKQAKPRRVRLNSARLPKLTLFASIQLVGLNFTCCPKNGDHGNVYPVYTRFIRCTYAVSIWPERIPNESCIDNVYIYLTSAYKYFTILLHGQVAPCIKRNG